MKTIKNSKELTALEVDDVVVFGNLEYIVSICTRHSHYYLHIENHSNDEIFRTLKLNKRDFIENLGIDANYNCDFPEVKSLEALTAIVSALFKEYEKQNEFPKTWEEFCNKYPITPGKEAFINTASRVMVYEGYRINRLVNDDRNLCISKQEAEAHLALMQLRQLRKAYVKNWEPDHKSEYFGIYLNYGDLSIMAYTFVGRSLSFPTQEIAQQFLTNFKDLLEVAKPLL